jgi:parallel beta-helix repeat protein
MFNYGLQARAARATVRRRPATSASMLTFLICLLPALSACGDALNLVGPDALPSLNTTSTGLTVTPTDPSLQVKERVQLEARDPNGKKVSASWSTSDKNVATVSSSGRVSAVANGSVMITATHRSRSGSVTVTVGEPVAQVAPVATVEVSPAGASLTAGGSTQLSATLRDASGNVLTDRAVSWTSGNASVATVSESGLVTAVAAGAAVISATAEGQSGSASIEVPPAQVAASSTDFGAVVRGVRPRGFGQGTYTLLQPASGSTMYWVATSGSDSNPGTSNQPFRTINRAAQVAVAGDVVTIRNGNYDESVTVLNGGTSSKRIVFQAENRGGVVLGGSHSRVWQPTGWNNGKYRTGAVWITVRGLVFREYSSLAAGAAAMNAGTGWTIEDCLFDRAGRDGLNLRGDFITLTRSTLRYNHQHAFTAWGPSNGATGPTDPKFEGIRDLRITDLIMHNNFHLDEPLDGALSSSVAKILATRGTIVDNIESHDNNGPGLWFDHANFEYVVRNSYFHGNKHLGTGYSPGRGLHIEINWAPGMVENNIFANNTHEGLALNNSSGVTVQGNLFVDNLQHIRLYNFDRGVNFPLKDIEITGNQFKDWVIHGAIHPFGDLKAAALPNIRADNNVFDPVRSTWLSWWSDAGMISTIAGKQEHLKWEYGGRIGSVNWPS